MTTKNPTISIVIPIYNTGKYLRDCIDSILSQSYTDYELILVDDGSTDDSIEIENHYSSLYDNVRVLHSNSGCVSSARNKGIEEASGQYILFVDSDDYLLPDCLKTFHENALRYPQADFIQAPFSVLSKGVLTTRSKRFDALDKFSNKIWNGTDYLQRMTLTITYPWNSLIKHSFLRETQVRFNPKLTSQEDLIFIIELFVMGAKGLLIEKPTYVYRFGREGSLTSIDTTLSSAEINKRKKVLKSLIESSFCLQNLAYKAPHIKDMLTCQINRNLTGCIGGCAILHPDKEMFNYLENTFSKIPVNGPVDRKMLAFIYNLSPSLAYRIRRYSLRNQQ